MVRKKEMEPENPLKKEKGLMRVNSAPVVDGGAFFGDSMANHID